MTQIELIQKPVIRHALGAVGKEISERLAALNIDGQIATEETVKSLKTLRADLNKELENYENQRKFVKGEVLKPYEEFDGVYKTEISDKYKSAIETLKDKIAFVENQLKAQKKEEIKQYFAELCASESVDFVTFDQSGVDINLSTSDKQYREKCIAFVSKIKDEIALIETQDFQAEIFVEYKKTLNAARAIADVRNRKEAEARESERLKAIEEAKQAVQPTPSVEILQAPAVVVNVIAQFEVECTQAQLTALGAYMRENKIIYRNI